MSRFFLLVLCISTVSIGRCLELKNGAYENFVVTVSDSVPTVDCQAILTNLEATLTSASQYLFSALDGRAFLQSATVVLPPSWPESCAPASKLVTSGTGETPDVTVLPADPARGRLWTLQPSGCGQAGEQIYLAYETLVKRDDGLARSLVKEFAMYRYGIFEEQGYKNDPIHPMCYYGDDSKPKVTGCSDLPINDNGICDGSSPSSSYNITNMVDPKARSSIMFAAEAISVSMFCDEGTHDRYAPTKHNLICQRRSTFDVIMSHEDFKHVQHATNVDSSQITNTTPQITYVKQTVTRYVLVIENTSDMLRRESWNFLRAVIRKWTVYDLPNNTEVGLVMTNDTGALKILNITQMTSSNRRDLVPSGIPYSPSDSSQSPCLHCALKEALHMLTEKTNSDGPATSVIITIGTGMVYTANMKSIAAECKKANVKIATINYPAVVRPDTLDRLATETDGQYFTVAERKANVDNTLLTTYFQMSNVLYNIIETYYSGNIADLPIEIHRREIKNDGRSSITGSFVLDTNMGEPAKFMLYTHNNNAPLIKSVKLISPSQQEFTTRSDYMLTSKVITLATNISETGTWTYTVEPFVGNPQPHFLQVLASPRSPVAPVLRTRFWTHRNHPQGPLILYAEVKHGDYPVLGAKVVAIVHLAEPNGTMRRLETLELLDTGSSDPDVTRGDGIYSRYFSTATLGGPGVYTVDVSVSDNGNTAYTWVVDAGSIDEHQACCGSKIPLKNVAPISPFQRVLPQKTLTFTAEEILKASDISAGRIGDLKVEIIPEDKKARLIWTSPDMGGHNVARYEIKYAEQVTDIADKFEIAASTWELGTVNKFPAGSETTFTLDMSQDMSLLDKPLYFAIKAFSQNGDQNSQVSNWVRVLVPSPPPPPTVVPTYSSNDGSWPFQNNNYAGPENNNNIGPSVAKSVNIGLELILPIVIGAIVLMVILILYCYCCVVKRRNRPHLKSNKSNTMNDKLTSTITIVPSSPSSPANQQQQYSPQHESPELQTVGVPISNYGYEDEPKKRYSIVQQQEQQLIEDLKQHQANNYNVSVISNTTLPRNGQQTLSPYNSWSASQLLHEHERRHSPNMMQDELQQQHHQQQLLEQQHIQQQMLDQHHTQMVMPEHYVQGHMAPPVPPLPMFNNSNGYPVNYSIYGMHQPQQQQVTHPSNAIYQTMHRTTDQGVVVAPQPFNGSLQGSLTSVNSGEKKRRNVTMV